MKNSSFKILLAVVWLMTACYPTSRLTVQPVSGDFKPSGSGFFYSLPRTVVEVSLELKHAIFIPGPYCKFAAQYLGIDGVQMQRKEEWTISSESINSFMERDPDRIFYAGFSKGEPRLPEILSLTKNGLIFSPVATYSSATGMAAENSNLKDSVWYTDLSMDYFNFQKTDTLFKTMLRDSIYVRIPVYKKEELYKSEESKAKEAANTIIKIRKRRFKLLSGEYNFITEGAALEVTVRELNRMEQEYLSLFLGKNYSVIQKFKTYVIPSLKPDPQIIFRYSKEQGILPLDSKAGYPVTCNILREKANIQPDISIVPADNILYFRIPENTIIQLLMNNKGLAEKRIAVYQFGRIQMMPVIPVNDMRRRRHS